MRIIAGEWRGRKLAEPRGREVTRPTTDRVREACASMVDSALEEGIESARVLDAFAGSGAMGMEMLSRGALFASFFDVDRQAAALVRKNLETMGCAAARYRVTSGDVVAMSARGRLAGSPFNLVILDPPYDFDPVDVSGFVERLAASGCLDKDALVLYEHASAKAGLSPAGFTQERDKRYGSTSVQLLRRVQEGEQPLDTQDAGE